jgi:TetR/AcrR family transcriptional repressor of nem operon
MEIEEMSQTVRDSGTADRALDAAQRLTQERGFNGFSYADIAQELGVSKAALHYHFASKAILGEALITRYRHRFKNALTEISAQGLGIRERLEAYIELFADVLVADRMCLCGMLAAEQQTLPEVMQRGVLEFFAENETWLEAVLNEGSSKGDLAYSGSAIEGARMLLGGLEGAMLLARSHNDVGRFRTSADLFLRQMVVHS